MTEKSEKTDVKNPEDESENKMDEELTALLDSALEDFKVQVKAPDSKQSSQENGEESKRPDPPQNLWDEEFLLQKFEKNLQDLFSPDGTLTAEQLGENIQKLAEAATQTGGFDASPDTEFATIMAETLKNLQENANNLNNKMNEEDLLGLFGVFGNMANSLPEFNGFMPVMQQLMQNLFSKDVLHPAVFHIVEKYPQWLEANKSKLSAGDFERYTEQLRIMKQVCAELEKESPDDSQEVKNARFDQVLALMQKVQDCGQPPAELIGESDPTLDGRENFQLPPNFSPSQCNFM